jgi:hypothetical protein
MLTLILILLLVCVYFFCDFRVSAGRTSSSVKIVEVSDDKLNSKSNFHVGTDACCTPKPTMTSQKGGRVTDSKKHQTAKKIASLVRNPSALKPRSQLPSSQVKSIKPSSVKRLVFFPKSDVR